MSRTLARVLLVLGIIALLLPIVAVVGALGMVAVTPAGPPSAAAPSEGGSGPVSENPFAGRGFYVDPDSKAAKAAALAQSSGNTADAEVFGKIAQQPTAIWIVPERNPLGQAGLYVGKVARQAAGYRATPVFVLYGIPDRDCGNLSAGGLSDLEYPLWIKEIGDALVGSNAAVILEPDSLALADQCGNVDRRVAQVSSALHLLTARGITVYLDGGHSNWLPPNRMAALLVRAGVADARGFATNVSNYNATAREIGYANELSSLTGGAHYVIDTGRNGRGSNGDWCNPPGRALGTTDEVVTNDPRHDANLWIKNPGESDGTCNGGPVAGDWWDASARELSRNAGW